MWHRTISLYIDHTLDCFQFRENKLCLSDPDTITTFSCYVIPAGWHHDSLNKEYAPATPVATRTVRTPEKPILPAKKEEGKKTLY